MHELAIMAGWKRLSERDAHDFYRVPVERAAADGNEFYGLVGDARDADSPRPLVALLRDGDAPAFVTLTIYTIEAEEVVDATFDPLSRPCGYLDLDREALTGLASLLEASAEQLPPSDRGARPMFRQLADAQLPHFGLRPDWPLDAADKHYAQDLDPLAEPQAGSSETILILSPAVGASGSRLYLKIAQFSRQALGRPDFDVLDDALARIQLDREGVRELARLLEAQIAEL